MRGFSLFVFIFLSLSLFAQKTQVSGHVYDKSTGEPIPFVKVVFQDTKIGVDTDFDGAYKISTYYATDSLVFSELAYGSQTVYVELDESQEIDIYLDVAEDIQQIDEIVVKAEGEFPSIILLKKVIKNKPINNREKLEAYQYETYNKIQLDMNNIGEQFEKRKPIQKMDFLLDYIDSTDGSTFLPLILSESISNYYFRSKPNKKKEVVKASKLSGIDNFELEQFMGEMYQDVNIYDNYLPFFDRTFISPISNFSQGFYKYYLEDSMFIDNQWCFKLRYLPKRKGDLTLEGEIWIHDTTYAVKSWSGEISPTANINYIKGLYIAQDFDQVEDEVWMLTRDRLVMDINITKRSKNIGIVGRKLTTRKSFVINRAYKPDFYDANEHVVVSDSAKLRDDEYWEQNRHENLTKQEADIEVMVDSLNNTPYFKTIKNLSYMVVTGYYPLGKIEIGNYQSLIGFNKVEKWRNQLDIRTSNDFSRTIELGGRIAYGYGDEKWKYGGLVRINLAKKKRALLSLHYNYDIEQIGQAPTAAEVGATFGALLRTGPLDKLTFVERTGVKIEKDFGKDIIITSGIEWKEFTPLGLARYERFDENNQIKEVSRLQTTEVLFKIRYAKKEEFVEGAFDRSSLGTRYPVFSLQSIFGIKHLLGADYEYQKVEASIEQDLKLGVFGKFEYLIYAGKVFGEAGYPFLKVHEGSASLWLQSNAHNKMGFYEFISDEYVGLIADQHWDGLFFDKIPLIRKLQWRLVNSVKAVYGSLNDQNRRQLILPLNTRSFGNTPYVEAGVGIENIFKVIRIDAVWRLTHLDPSINPIGIRGKVVIRL